MENRLANLKLNENLNEEHHKEKQQEIEQECVSKSDKRKVNSIYIFI